MKRFWGLLLVFSLVFACTMNVSAAPAAGSYEVLLHWNHLEWDFPSAEFASQFGTEYWKKAMPAGFKVDQNGNYYLSVPRWAPNIPATLNRVVMKNNKPVLEAYPNWKMNEEGNPDALQSVLGYEIDKNGLMWILDQGHVNRAVDGAQKIVVWDTKADKLVDIIKIPSGIADYKASFLNDIVLDSEDGFAYIADSGNNADPRQAGIIVYNMKTKHFRRVLNQHFSVQDVPDFRFQIAGEDVSKDKPMRTGADGIALSADKKTLYWCPLTSRHLYSVDTALLQDFTVPMHDIEVAVKDHGNKGTTTDGMSADNHDSIWYTMLEGQGIGKYDPMTDKFAPFITDKRMVWVDGLQFDNHGYVLFNNNRLHQLFGGELDWNDDYNFIIWKAYVGDEVKSYQQ